MESSHIATLQLPGLSKKARHIHIFPKTRTAQLISLGVLCDDGFTITLYNQEMSVQKWKTNNKMYQEQANRNLVSSPGDTTIINCGK